MVPSLLVRLFFTFITLFGLLSSTSYCFTPAIGVTHHHRTQTITTTSSSSLSSLASSSAGPSILERETTVRVGGPAILERPAVIERKRQELAEKDHQAAKEGKFAKNESWEVRIYNDGLNTREHVARCLVQVTGLSEYSAYQTMMHAHQHGMAVVGRYVYEIAEMYHDQLKTKGLICDIIPVEEE